jgi:hypothetical protein
VKRRWELRETEHAVQSRPRGGSSPHSCILVSEGGHHPCAVQVTAGQLGHGDTVSAAGTLIAVQWYHRLSTAPLLILLLTLECVHVMYLQQS